MDKYGVNYANIHLLSQIFQSNIATHLFQQYIIKKYKGSQKSFRWSALCLLFYSLNPLVCNLINF